MQQHTKKGDGEPKAASHEIQNINPQPPNVGKVVAIEESIVKPHGDAIIKLDRSLVENEARGTIYCIALGLIAKEALSLVKKVHPRRKKAELLSEFLGSLNLSAGRSVRTIERYMEVAQNMIDDRTLKGVLTDALRDANFTDEVKAEFLHVTDKMGLNELYLKYDMLGDRKTKVKTAKKGKVKNEKPKSDENLTLEQRLVHSLRAALNNLTQLMSIRDELLAAGKVIDGAFKEVLDYAAETLSAIMKHPIIAAKFQPVDDESAAAGDEPEAP